MNRNRLRSAHLQHGVTLVELMVALVVGLILLAGLIQLFISNKQAYRIQEGANIVNENARYALAEMQYDLRMADHWGGVEGDGLDTVAGSDTVTSDCGGNAAAVLNVGVFGIEDASNSPLTCIPAADYLPNTDIIVLRYAMPTRVATGSLAGTTFYVRSASGRRGVLLEGKNKSSIPSDLASDNASETDPYKETPVGVANYQLRTAIYYLRRCASQDRGTAGVCDGADDTVPSLARLSLQGTSMVAEDVIAGVEQMQLAYGVDLNGDRSADVFQTATEVTAANNWNRIVSVKMSLVLRNGERDTTFTDTNTYQLYGGASGAPRAYTPAAGDRQFRRKVYNSTTQIRNMTRG